MNEQIHIYGLREPIQEYEINPHFIKCDGLTLGVLHSITFECAERINSDQILVLIDCPFTRLIGQTFYLKECTINPNIKYDPTVIDPIEDYNKKISKFKFKYTIVQIIAWDGIEGICARISKRW